MCLNFHVRSFLLSFPTNLVFQKEKIFANIHVFEILGAFTFYILFMSNYFTLITFFLLVFVLDSKPFRVSLKIHTEILNFRQ